MGCHTNVNNTKPFNTNIIMAITTATISRGNNLLIRLRTKAAAISVPASPLVPVVSACISQQRTFSDSRSTKRLPFSKSSLGLDRNHIIPYLPVIQQLPEVDTAWNEFPSAKTIEFLHRALDVFGSFNKGGNEHFAVSALLAETLNRNGLYDDALITLDEMALHVEKNHTLSISHASDDLLIAKAKVLWTKGEFSQCQELCDSMISRYDSLQESFPTTPLHLASAMTGKALAQLVAMNSIDDAFSVRDYFRITIKFLERHPAANSLPLAAAHANCGTAEAVYNAFLEETNNVSVPINAALKTWFQGLQMTERERSEESLGPQMYKASKVLQATIQANLAWGILNYENDRSDRLIKASEYAKQGLNALGQDNSFDEEGLRRVLSVVAACYQQAGSAITSEGLLQSATNRKKMPSSPLPLLELQDALLGYSKLCLDWEKRESDSERLKRESLDIDDKLPQGWRGKSGIHSSLWFWMPADFQ